MTVEDKKLEKGVISKDIPTPEKAIKEDADKPLSRLTKDDLIQKIKEREQKTEEISVPVLTKIQNELKAPKSQFNKFGNYSYRNAEDILEAVKPLLLKYGASLTLTDKPVEVADRLYIKATAHYKDCDSEKIVESYARESLTKKGMDDSQISGSASSYARKYALNGLFLIDDTKDADSNALQRQQSARQSNVNYNRRNYTKKPVNQWSIQELESYPLNFNGKIILLSQAFSSVQKGNAKAKEFVDNLKGTASDAYVELNKRMIQQNSNNY